MNRSFQALPNCGYRYGVKVLKDVPMMKSNQLWGDNNNTAWHAVS